MQALQAVPSRMQLTIRSTRRTPHGALRFAQATSAWSVKIRRAPSRHSGDARVYGHTTTGHAQTEYIPPGGAILEVLCSGFENRSRIVKDYCKHDPIDTFAT